MELWGYSIELKEIFHPRFFEIFNEKYFFELSADIGDKLEIYCDEPLADYENGEVLYKDEFFKRLRAYPLQEVKQIVLNE